jgi:MFS family permease
VAHRAARHRGLHEDGERRPGGGRPAALSSDRLLSRPFVLCAAANALQSLAFNLYLHLPGFLHDLGADEVEIGVLSAVTAAAAIGVRPALGRALDRGSRRRLVLAAGLLNSATCVLYTTVATLGPWIYVLRVAQGLAEATLFTALFTIAADLVPASRRTEGLALYSATGMVPISLGGLLGDAILARAPYATLFAASASAAAASFAVSLWLVERPARPGRAAGAPAGGGFLGAVRQRDLAPLWFVGTVFGVVLAGVFVFVKRFVMESDAGTVGGFFSAYTGAAIAVRVLGGRLPDRVGPKRVLVPALGLLALGFACLAAARGPAEVLAAGFLCGVGHGFTFPTLSSLAVTRARPGERGAAIAVLTALPDLGALLGAPSLGWIIEEAGFPAMFSTAAAVLVLGTAAFAGWDRRAERPAVAPEPAVGGGG